MDKPVFSIRSLACSYNNSEQGKVLFIDHLDIPQGELVFLLGSSGSGKSTLLETLGLMNNTIAGGSILFNGGDNAYRYEELWKTDNKERSEVRKKHFSFIFQNTNLMENFTAYENVCLPRMIQEDVKQADVMTDAMEMMKRVGLRGTQVTPKTLAVNLSGGQRQRLAFVRALSSKCSVLLCDEPTGNLDEENANELMSVIKDVIAQRKITALVVSHDINLAINHASRIICVTKSVTDNFGTVNDKDIYTRAQWENLGHEELFQFRNKIKAYYKPDTNKQSSPDEQSGESLFNLKFNSLFLRKEGAALAGKNYVNLLVLFALFFCTFLSIGFANGSLEYLEKKLNNPFVLWLNVTVPDSKAGDIERIKKELSNEDIRAKYFIAHATSYATQPIDFLNKNTDKFEPKETRTVEMKGGADPIISDLTEGKHLIMGDKGFRGEKDLSLIVTQRFLEELGYAKDAPFVFMKAEVHDTSAEGFKSYTMPVGIRAVVQEIPGKVQCAYTDYFLEALKQRIGSTFNPQTKGEIWLFSPGSKKDADSLKTLIRGWLNATNNEIGPEVNSPDTCRDTYAQGFKVAIDFFPAMVSDSLEIFYKKLATDPKLANYMDNKHVMRIYNYGKFDEHFTTDKSVDQLSINFSRLDKVRDFAEYLLIHYNDSQERKTGNIIEADLGKVRDKENFEFLSNMTKIISLIIILLGTIAVCLFIFNLLKMHLSKVKMNIGTFTASGLSNISAQMIYFQIVLLFISICLLLSFTVAGVVGNIIDRVVTNNLVLETGVHYFKLFGSLTYYNIGFTIVLSLIISYFTIRQMLAKSPGDLIYNR